MNIVTVLKLGGDFDESHVERLQKQIGQPIFCLTDSMKEMEGVESIPLKYDWSGWWSKMEMFSLRIDFLYVDLDTTFLNGVPDFDTGETIVLSDMYGGDHINTGLMYIKFEDNEEIWNAWVKSPREHMKGMGLGDQQFINLFWKDKARWQTKYPGLVVSYKADILKEGFTGDGVGIICFHGEPRPWEIEE